MKNIIIGIFIVLSTLQLTAQTVKNPAKVISFKKLQEFLPTKAPAGFTRQKPKGQTMSSAGISSSNATVEFTAPKKITELQTMDDGKQDSVEVDITWTATIEIADFAGMGEGMASTMQMISGMEFENETDNGYEKSITFNDYKGIEKISSEENSNSCSIQLVVGNRFMVSANGNGFADTAILHSLLKTMELKKLEQTK
jgi:hypothetical protein